MGVLQLAKLVEFLNAGDLQRCGCAEEDSQQFFAEAEVLARSKTTPGRYLSSHIIADSPEERRPLNLQKFRALACDSFAATADATSDGEDTVYSDIGTGLVDCDDEEVDDDELASSASSQRLASEIWLGPDNASATADDRVQQAPLSDWTLDDVQSPQPISWELPPLAVPAPISPEVGVSLWSARSQLYTSHYVAPGATGSALPFSALLCQALEHVAWEAPSLDPGNTYFELECAPPAVEVPQTQLACKLSSPCKPGKELSAAQRWLGEEPSDR